MVAANCLHGRQVVTAQYVPCLVDACCLHVFMDALRTCALRESNVTTMHLPISRRFKTLVLLLLLKFCLPLPVFSPKPSFNRRDAGVTAWLWGSDVHSFEEVARRVLHMQRSGFFALLDEDDDGDDNVPARH